MPVLPRIEFDQFPQQLAAALAPRVSRLGYLGEFFKCAAHQPQALQAFMEFTEAGKKGLPSQLVEVVALSVAGWMGNAYERNQHERLCMRLGFGREWIEAVNALQPRGTSVLTPQERQVQGFVLSALDKKGHGVRDAFEQLVAELGPQGAMAVLMVIGRYLVHAIIVNTLELAPPVPSIFEDGFVP